MGIGSRSLLVGVLVSLLLIGGFSNAAFAATQITSLSVTYSGPDGASIEVTNTRGALHGTFNVNDLSSITVLPTGTDSDFKGPRTIFTIFDKPDLDGNVIDIFEINSSCKKPPIIDEITFGSDTSLQVDGFTGCKSLDATSGDRAEVSGNKATQDGAHHYGDGDNDIRQYESNNCCDVHPDAPAC